RVLWGAVSTCLLPGARACAATAAAAATIATMQVPEVLSPVLGVATAAMESFVSWCQEHEWIASKSLFLVTPGEGLDAKALELADTIQLDAGT
ncbi:unnamed protein product, partial [Ectocarpus sp. 8 AP-2014]